MANSMGCKGYGLAFRQMVLKVKKEENLGYVKTAKRFGIHPLTVRQWLKNDTSEMCTSK